MLHTVLRPDYGAGRTHTSHKHWPPCPVSILHVVYLSEFQRGRQNSDRNKRKANSLPSPGLLKGIRPSSGPHPTLFVPRGILRYIRLAYHDQLSSPINVDQALTCLGLSPTLTFSPTQSFPLWGCGTCATSATSYSLTSSR